VIFCLATQEKPELSSVQQDPALQKLDNVKALLKDSNYTEAEALARKILSEVEVTFGIDSAQAAQVLDVLVESIFRRKIQTYHEYWEWTKRKSKEERDSSLEPFELKQKQAEEEVQMLIEQAMSIRERIFGPEHPEVVRGLANLSGLVERHGNNSIVKSLEERALVIFEKTYGPNHAEIAKILDELGTIYYWEQEPDKANEILERSLRIKEMVFGIDHISLAKTHDRIGILYGSIGQLDEAKSHIERSLEIREKALDSEDIDVTDILDGWNEDALIERSNTIGLFGCDDNVLILWERTISILEKTLGPEHPEVASQLENVAIMYGSAGNWTKVIQYYELSLPIKEKFYGTNHWTMAYSLNPLAIALSSIGDQERARMIFERCIAILEGALGKEFRGLLTFYNNFSQTLVSMGDYKQAEVCVKRILELEKLHFGPNAPRTAITLNTYSKILRLLGDYNVALELQQRALPILEESRRTDEPNTVDAFLNDLVMVRALQNLAALLINKGEIKKALTQIKNAHAIEKKIINPEHPSWASMNCELAEYLLYDGQLATALKEALHSEEIARDHLRLRTSLLSERGALANAAMKSQGLDICLSLAVKSQKGMEANLGKVWDSLIRSRAIIYDEMAARHRILTEVSNPEISSLVESFNSARQNLANLVVRGTGSFSQEKDYQNQLSKARTEKEQAERALARASATYRETFEQSRAGLIEIKSSLPPGFALLSFARYIHYEPPSKEVETENGLAHGPVQLPYYLAFVLRAQDRNPTVVPLGKAEEIEPLIFDWGQEAARGTRIPGRSEKESVAAYRAAGEALRRKLWDPIVPHLGDARSVLLIPDGALHTINFAALPVGSKEYLIEKGPLLHYLSAERDLISSRDSTVKGEGLLALGDPTFDETSLFAALSPESKPEKGLLAKVKSVFHFRGMRSECGDFKSLKFKPLPATHKEINEVTPIWKKSQEREGDILKLTGAMANEREFKMAAPGKKILHLATHGFFLENNCPSALARLENKWESGWSVGKLPPITGENPLLLSGLALAGANHREAAGLEEEDGILTAEEVATLNLSGINWVVLSACDTGVGKIRAGEGVFGLRRAFRLAGAKTLITSLWAIEDEAAQRWMRELYKARFIEGLGTAEAVWKASLELLRDLRKRRKSTHPFYWAGFVASGDWR
jgi:CHAT domain-containing protein/tetratricopeptide (TPR) repeat protein